MNTLLHQRLPIVCVLLKYYCPTTLYSNCDQTSDLWQQLELASELQSNLRDTVDWCRKWLVDFNTGKFQLLSFHWSNSTGAIDVKMDGSVLGEKSFFKMLGLTLSSKLDCCSYITSIAKIVSKKIGVLICSMKFLSPEGDSVISVNLPYGHAWNTVVMSGLVLLTATCNC